MQSKVFLQKSAPQFCTVFRKKGIKRYTLRTKNAQKWYHVCVENFYRKVFNNNINKNIMFDDNKSENTVFVAPPKTLFSAIFSHIHKHYHITNKK